MDAPHQGRWGVFSSQGDYVTSLVEKLETAFGAARQVSTCVREIQKLYHDREARHNQYTVGSWSSSLILRRTGGNLRLAGKTHTYYDRLKPHKLPLLPGSSSTPSPPLVPS